MNPFAARDVAGRPVWPWPTALAALGGVSAVVLADGSAANAIAHGIATASLWWAARETSTRYGAALVAGLVFAPLPATTLTGVAAPGTAATASAAAGLALAAAFAARVGARARRPILAGCAWVAVGIAIALGERIEAGAYVTALGASALVGHAIATVALRVRPRP